MLEAMLWFVLLVLCVPVLFVAGLVWTFFNFVLRTAAWGVRLVMRPVVSIVLLLLVGGLLILAAPALLF